MKRIFVVLLFLPFFCFGQNKKALNHFWDIPWGTSIERAEVILTERGLPVVKNGECLISQGKYEGEEAVIMLFFNKVKRFYSGNVIYDSSVDTAISKYQNYRIVLFRRYGMPDTAVEYFTEGYSKGDGREIEAINTEKAFYFTEWQFNDNCQASVSILSNLDVCLTFKNPIYSDADMAKK